MRKSDTHKRNAPPICPPLESSRVTLEQPLPGLLSRFGYTLYASINRTKVVTAHSTSSRASSSNLRELYPLSTDYSRFPARSRFPRCPPLSRPEPPQIARPSIQGHNPEHESESDSQTHSATVPLWALWCPITPHQLLLTRRSPSRSLAFSVSQTPFPHRR
jgi:hypothetical protein